MFRCSDLRPLIFRIINLTLLKYEDGAREQNMYDSEGDLVLDHD
jgi:hypothetical protein